MTHNSPNEFPMTLQSLFLRTFMSSSHLPPNPPLIYKFSLENQKPPTYSIFPMLSSETHLQFPLSITKNALYPNKQSHYHFNSIRENSGFSSDSVKPINKVGQQQAKQNHKTQKNLLPNYQNPTSEMQFPYAISESKITMVIKKLIIDEKI